MAPSSSITVQDNIVFPGTIRVPLTVKFLTSRSQISCSTAILPAISGFIKPFLTLAAVSGTVSLGSQLTVTLLDNRSLY
jgi:hypothetical protein